MPLPFESWRNSNMAMPERKGTKKYRANLGPGEGESEVNIETYNLKFYSNAL